MQKMTARERVHNALEHRPVDRLPVAEGFWAETLARWRTEGHLGPDEDPVDHFDLDLRRAGGINSLADLDFEPVVLEETAETILRLDGNGASLRRHKLYSTTPEHVDFKVKERTAWEELIKPHLTQLDRRRIPFDNYREERRKADEQERHFCWAGMAPFEQMHPMCGHEYMLMGMALDPDWVRDMVDTYADLTIRHLEVLFAEEGLPDSIWFYEDMGYKQSPFMSPKMYADIMRPGHERLFRYAHDLGRKIIVHSCGFVEPLLPDLIAAGMDCLQAMEVKAGMDMPRLWLNFGKQISFCGNIDVRELVSNDPARVRTEVDCKIRPILAGGGSYILHSDHSIPPDVDYETYRDFLAYARPLGQLTWPVLRAS